MHLDQNRLGDLIVEVVDVDLDTVLEWGLIGYYVGAVTGFHIPVFVNAKRTPNLSMFMALNAAGASSGSVIMYHIVGVTPEAATLQMATGSRKTITSIKYGKKEREWAYLKLNHSKSTDVDIVLLGCPHYSIERIRTVARLLERNSIHENTSLFITTCKQIKVLADRNGYTEIINRAGGLLLEDTCGLEFAHDQSAIIATDSPKQAHYSPGVCGVENVRYGTTEECIEAAITSKWRGELK
jgi:predicted aconitase